MGCWREQGTWKRVQGIEKTGNIAAVICNIMQDRSGEARGGEGRWGDRRRICRRPDLTDVTAYRANLPWKSRFHGVTSSLYPSFKLCASTSSPRRSTAPFGRYLLAGARAGTPTGRSAGWGRLMVFPQSCSMRRNRVGYT